jgi:hypothetical protein
LAGEARAQSLTLIVDVFAPSPPIMFDDLVRLRARTPIDVFPDSSHSVSSTFSINGFNIDWDITSMDIGGVSLPALEPMGTIHDIGALPPGTYQVDASWTHVGGGLLDDVPSSGTGGLSFTVVPEPHSSALLAAALLCCARRRRRTPAG